MSDPAKGSSPENNTVGAFLTSLALNSSLLLLQVGIFVILKNKLARIYSPRAYLPPPEKRADELASGLWRWLPQTLSTPSQSIIRKNGLDAYMSIRFFEMMMKVFLVFTAVTFPILLPINAVGMATKQDGLARLGFGNINAANQTRYVAHLLVAYGLTGFVLWLMRKELMLFIHLRQRFLLSKYHSRLAQAKTVLITALPKELAHEHDLRQLFSFVPGGINKIWIYRNVEGLPEAYEERTKLCDMLEGASTSLLQTAIKARVQQETKKEKEHLRETGESTENKEPANTMTFPFGVHANVHDEAFAGDLERIGAQSLLGRLHRPQHRTSWIPFWGPKVDTIEHCMKRIGELNEQIDKLRTKLPEQKSFGAAFIQCNLQIGAHVMAQCVSYHEPLFMSQRWTEVAPEDVVWANIDDGAYEVRTRYVLSWAATLGLIILWGFPVALAGFTSNVDAACSTHWWLAWICETPKIVQSLIQGVFPPVLLAVLFLILPYLLKGLAWFENIPRWSLISISVYKRYFMFLVVHGFLIITFFSALSQVLRDLQSPSKIIQNVSVYLPNASTFFLTYMLQQGLMGAAGALLQVGPLIMYFIKRLFFGNTPREAFQATFTMPSFDFGIMLPRMSLLATIGFAYAIISPIINLLALCTFALFWLSWKFLLIWVLDQPDAQETSGLYFPLLMSNLFTGLYIQQVCLMGLFFFAKDENDEHNSIPLGVLMAILIFLTASAQIFFKHAFEPVISHIPMSLSTKKLTQRFGKTQKEDEEGRTTGVDLFSRDRVRSAVRYKLRLRRGSSRRVAAAHKTAVSDEKQAAILAKEAKKREESEKAMYDAARLMEAADAEAKKSGSTTAGQGSKASERLGIKDGALAPAAPGPGVDDNIASIKEAGESKASVRSAKSDKSKKSGSKGGEEKKGKNKLIGALATAAPNAIEIAAPSKALKDDSSDDDDGSDTDDDLEEHAFDHPSTYLDQRWIWIPRWEEHPELSEELVRELKEGRVEASDLGAFFESNGLVRVNRGPPDEDWGGGFDS